VILEENHIFSPTMVNSFRLGFNRTGVANNQGVGALNPVANEPSLAAVPWHRAGFVVMGGGVAQMPGGLNAVTHYFHYWNSWQVYDDAFLTRGAHSFKFGGNLERIEYNYIGYQEPGGKFFFGGLQSFLTNQPNKFEASVASTVSPRGLRQTLFGAYVQDDWRWRSNLTVNLGLRYEMVSIPTEVQGKLVHLNSMTDTTLHLGSPVMPNPTKLKFEPHLGFS
jgi:outer membrane receptor protein involved in Fe transport